MIKLYYEKCANFGDAIAPTLLSSLLKCDESQIKWTKRSRAGLLSIGSILGDGRNLLKNAKNGFIDGVLPRKTLKAFLNPPMIVWGSGFILEPPAPRVRFLRKFQIHALRGKLSREVCLKYGMAASSQSITLGDPGLLFSTLIEKENIDTKYDIGIVPHYSDFLAGKVLAMLLKRAGVNVNLIDVSQPPLDVIRQIKSCDVIASSSLHGCITADSLHIPNKHIMISSLGFSKAAGFSEKDCLFKYLDYYSAFDYSGHTPLMFDEAVDLGTDLMSTIKAKNALSADQIEERKEKLAASLPRAELSKFL